MRKLQMLVALTAALTAGAALAAKEKPDRPRERKICRTVEMPGRITPQKVCRKVQRPAAEAETPRSGRKPDEPAGSGD